MGRYILMRLAGVVGVLLAVSFHYIYLDESCPGWTF